MNAALCLLIYAAALCWLAPAALTRVTGRGLSPRFAVMVWLTTITVSTAAWIAGTAGILRELLGPHSVDPVRYCTDVILAVHHLGWGGDLLLGIAGIATLAASFIVSRRTVTALQRFWLRSREHAHAAHILGTPTHRPGVIMVQTDHAAAYCVAGRPHAIVVTSAAVETLTEPELAAVLAHERAHLSGCHPQLMMLLRALAASMPALPLFSAAVPAVARLVEMSADDSAARKHGRDALLRGLIALAGPMRTGGAALAAADTAVLARAERLATPALWRALLRERVTLTATLALVATPALLAFVYHS